MRFWETFSYRLGFKQKPSRTGLDDEMPERLRNALWNFLSEAILKVEDGDTKLAYHTWTRFLGQANVDYSTTRPLVFIRNEIYKFEAHEMLSFIEWLHSNLLSIFRPQPGFYAELHPGDIQNAVNDVFEEHLYPYRMIDGLFVPVSSSEELESLQSTIDNVKESPAAQNFRKAVAYMRGPDADYPNSIKESVSALESLVREMTGKKTLGEGLKQLGKDGAIPSLLKESADKIYAYSCDEAGIRHGGIGSSDAAFPEARLALVVCSAWINSLKPKRLKQE